jgi:hypothetical protein
MLEKITVWVFNGHTKRGANFPSAVFRTIDHAEEWIQKNAISGLLTRYPIDMGVYEWAILEGFFKPEGADQISPSFIETFSFSGQEQYSYQNGQRIGSTVSSHTNNEFISTAIIQQHGESSLAQVSSVWLFNGYGIRYPNFPSAAFLTRYRAEEWIKIHAVSGTLTEYPLDVGVYEWAILKGFFKPTKEKQTTPAFIETFSSASQEHYHYEHGQ